MMTEKKKELKKKANTLPLLPGVYIMKDAKGNIIYIGKAIKLKNRVTQYFGSPLNHTQKVRQMTSNADDFEYVVCDSEFEALTLENSLIKQHMPKYNILLKDDKGYHYVRITKEKWRRIQAVKNNSGTGTFIGPFNSGKVVRETVEQAQRIFKLPNCNRNFEKPSKPCLNYHIGICSAPCRNKIKIEEYNESVDAAVDFIKKGGIGAQDIKRLEEQMNTAADALNFEYAAKLRDRINSLKRIAQKQKVITSDTYRHDCFASAMSGDKVCVEVFTFSGGHLSDQNNFIFDSIGSRGELYSELLPQYYAEREVPKELLLDEMPDGEDAVTQWLNEKSGHTVTLTVPKIGDKRRLVEMCTANAAEHLSHIIERNMYETAALDELGKLLGIVPPRYIESYDISNISGAENVAGMVVFKDGRPCRENYRKFKIKSFVGQDDYRSMAEVLDRRLCEYEKGTDPAFSVLPDLILLDGGRGQLSAVMPVLAKHGADIKIFGMVKDSKHRTDAIAAQGGNIVIKSNRSAFRLVTQIQDEVHRFAISFHKNRRSRSMTASVLTEISGIGPKKAAALFKHFKSIKNIKQADAQFLCSVKEINKTDAENIINYFGKDTD